MKFLITILFLISSHFGFVQTINKHHTFNFEGSSFLSNPYLNLTGYKSDELTKKLFGLEFNTCFDVATTLNFNFSWTFAFQTFNTKKEFSDSLSQYFTHNLKKFRTGPSFYFGNINQFELGFNMSFGRLKTNVQYSISNHNLITGIGEANLNIGYRHFFNKGLVFRTGILLNKGYTKKSVYNLNGMYLSLGYDFKSTIAYKPKEKYKQFIVLSGMGYLFDFQKNVIGIGIIFDHFLYNTQTINLGYSLMLRAGTGIFTISIPFNSTISGVLLVGNPKNHKLEIDFGVNLPLNHNYNSIKTYNLINFGLGYRFIDDDISFKIGTSTTGILNLGLGIVL